MNKTTESSTVSAAPKKKPGFLQRMIEKLDKAMKQKANEKSGGCCGGGGKGGKCC